MKHLGDITKLHGYDAQPVDCITFGSPCQDLSVAGKRAGLAGERSGLFMDAVRIIKEMRGATNGRYPTFAVWENVAGAFSSNGGEDFRAVLEELASVKGERVNVPRPEKRWKKAGFICGDDWSIAWRLFDAQYWGVPQRRKRIALVADFAGQRAGEILFERESLSGHSEESKQSWQEIAGYPAYGSGECCKPYGISGYTSNAMLSSNPHSGIYEADTSRTLDLNGGSPACNQGGIAIVSKAVDFRNLNVSEDITGTLQSKQGGGYSLNYQPGVLTYSKTTRPHSTAEAETWKESDTACTVNAFDVGESRANEIVTYQDKTGTLSPGQHCGSYNGQDAYNDMLIAYNSHPNDSRITEASDECIHTLSSRMGTGGNNIHLVADTVHWIVRRLTPTECERLQGFPDGWTDIGDWTDSKGKKHKASDTPRYKALGNSIALPQWHWLTQRMSTYLPENATLGSLFDGIGGFPLVWEMVHGKGTALWASEIEEFPMAVTKIRFGGD